ncbi:MAG: hypothetical protein WB424_00570 [Terracidiphilus sp.]
MKLSEHPLVRRYSGRCAVLDANVLLLHMLCALDFSLLSLFKRLEIFEEYDYLLLSELLKSFSGWCTTPHVLTEVSNLTNSLPGWRKSSWTEYFSEQIQLIPELFEDSAQIASDASAIRFGLTDAALASLANTHLVITVDWPLTGFLESRGLAVLNLRHLKGIEFTL